MTEQQKYEIKLAEAIKIEPGKTYIVIFESDRDFDSTDVGDIQQQISKLFKRFGARVKPIVITDGRIKIAEVRDGDQNEV